MEKGRQGDPLEARKLELIEELSAEDYLLGEFCETLAQLMRAQWRSATVVKALSEEELLDKVREVAQSNLGNLRALVVCGISDCDLFRSEYYNSKYRAELVSNYVGVRLTGIIFPLVIIERVNDVTVRMTEEFIWKALQLGLKSRLHKQKSTGMPNTGPRGKKDFRHNPQQHG